MFQLSSRAAAPADHEKTLPPGVGHPDLQERTVGVLLTLKASGKALKKKAKKKILSGLWTNRSGQCWGWKERPAFCERCCNLTDDAFRWPAVALDFSCFTSHLCNTLFWFSLRALLRRRKTADCSFFNASPSARFRLEKEERQKTVFEVYIGDMMLTNLSESFHTFICSL